MNGATRCPSRNGTTMRLPRLLPILLAASLGLTACGGGADPATDDGTTSPTPSATATTEPTTEPTPDPTAAPTSEPTATTSPTSADCSAAGITGDVNGAATLPDEAAATAAFLLDAAVRCDEPLLVTAATESDTQILFGNADASTFFGLPEDDEQVYGVIATLLTEVPYAAQADDSTPATFVWPRVATGDRAEADEAWQEVVDAGLLTQTEADEQRAAGSGYLGWRIGITGDGDWQFLTAGD
jgi:hypothetical protein